MITHKPGLDGRIAARNNVVLSGSAGPLPIVFGHGFGCDQTVWRHLAPMFEPGHPVVLFDHVGSGQSDMGAYRPRRYSSLRGYAEDVVEMLEELAGPPVVFVGHSASAMIGLLAAIRRPALFSGLVLVCGSPYFLDGDGYAGGFSPDDVEGMLTAMRQDYDGWVHSLAALVSGDSDPRLVAELARAFSRKDPSVAVDFARATFLSDHRGELPRLRVPTLVMQTTDDPLVPAGVGAYLHRGIPGSRYSDLVATGHYPHLTAPRETAAVIASFLEVIPR